MGLALWFVLGSNVLCVSHVFVESEVDSVRPRSRGFQSGVLGFSFLAVVA